MTLSTHIKQLHRRYLKYPAAKTIILITILYSVIDIISICTPTGLSLDRLAYQLTVLLFLVLIWGYQKLYDTHARIYAIHAFKQSKNFFDLYDIAIEMANKLELVEANELQSLIDDSYAHERAYYELGIFDKASFHCGMRTAYMKLKLKLHPDIKGRAYPYDESLMRQAIDRYKKEITGDIQSPGSEQTSEGSASAPTPSPTGASAPSPSPQGIAPTPSDNEQS